MGDVRPSHLKQLDTPRVSDLEKAPPRRLLTSQQRRASGVEVSEDVERAWVLAVGDPHFRATASEECAELHAAVRDLIVANKPAAVVVLGDVLHAYDRVNMHALRAATAFLAMIAIECETQLVVLIGNHDRPNNTTLFTDEHAFGALKHWPRTTVVDAPTLVDVAGHRVAALPYVPRGRFAPALKPLLAARPALVFAHQELRGCRLREGVSTSPDAYPADAPLCISGHIHTPARPQPNVVYPGSPYHTSTVTSLEPPSRNLAVLVALPRGGSPPALRYVPSAIRARATLTVGITLADQTLEAARATFRSARVLVACKQNEVAATLEKLAASHTQDGLFNFVPVVSPPASDTSDPTQLAHHAPRSFKDTIIDQLSSSADTDSLSHSTRSKIEYYIKRYAISDNI